MIYGVVSLIGDIVKHFSPKESISAPEKVRTITENDTPPPAEERENAFAGLYLVDDGTEYYLLDDSGYSDQGSLYSANGGMTFDSMSELARDYYGAELTNADR